MASAPEIPSVNTVTSTVACDPAQAASTQSFSNFIRASMYNPFPPCGLSSLYPFGGQYPPTALPIHASSLNGYFGLPLPQMPPGFHPLPPAAHQYLPMSIPVAQPLPGSIPSIQQPSSSSAPMGIVPSQDLPKFPRSPDSGNESGEPVEHLDSPNKCAPALDLRKKALKVVTGGLEPIHYESDHQHGGSQGPASPTTSKSSSGASSAGVRPSKTGQIVASLLRGEDFCASTGSGSSRGHLSDTDDMEHDGDISSEGSSGFRSRAGSLQANFVAQLGASPELMSAGPGMLQILQQRSLSASLANLQSQQAQGQPTTSRLVFSQSLSSAFSPRSFKDAKDSAGKPSSPKMDQRVSISPKGEITLTSPPLQAISPAHSEHSCSSGSSNFAPLPSNAQDAQCSVCGDVASGFHYGVVSCEGCKGFFRRTVQKNIDYNCHKDGTCVVNKITRNRCQACRFNKCLQCGMTKESVRMDKNRKRKVQPDDQAEEEIRLTTRIMHIVKSVVKAHNDSIEDFTVANDVFNFIHNELVASNGKQGLSKVLAFCQKLPDFEALSRKDQEVVFRHGWLEIWLLRNSFALLGSDAVSISDNPGDNKVLKCMCKLRDALSQLNIFYEELALLCAICLYSPTRPGLEHPSRVEEIQGDILEALKVQVYLRNMESDTSANEKRLSPQCLFPRLLLKISDIRSIISKELDQAAGHPVVKSEPFH